jgi:integrase
MPAHHKAEEYVDAYLEAAGLWDQKHAPIFRAAIGKTKQLGTKRMTRHAALKMIQRRARGAEILTPICCHSFRATGITNYLENGGTLDKASPHCTSGERLSRLSLITYNRRRSAA